MATFSFAAHNRLVTSSSICESLMRVRCQLKDRHGLTCTSAGPKEKDHGFRISDMKTGEAR